MAEQRSDRKTFEEQLDELRKQIGDLVNKLETAVDREAEALRPKLKVAQEKLHELKNASSEAWDDLKPGLKRAWEEMHKSLNQAASRFKSRPNQ